MKPLLSAFDLNLLMAGKHHHAWKILGAHPLVLEGVEGCRFAVWAPVSYTHLDVYKRQVLGSIAALPKPLLIKAR